MSTATKITASGVPFVPEGREEKTAEKKREAALWARFQELNKTQAAYSFAPRLWGALTVMPYCHETITMKSVLDALERAVEQAESWKDAEDGK